MSIVGMAEPDNFPGLKPDDAALEIHVVSRQLQYLVAPPAGVVRKVEHVLIRPRQLCADFHVFVMFKEPVACRILF